MAGWRLDRSGQRYGWDFRPGEERRYAGKEWFRSGITRTDIVIILYPKIVCIGTRWRKSCYRAGTGLRGPNPRSRARSSRYSRVDSGIPVIVSPPASPHHTPVAPVSSTKPNQ